MTKNEVDPGIMVMVDFEKAFDTVSWDFLHKTLEFFNFGPTFKKYIKLLYASPECCVTNNGFHTEFFPISRGIRQGCPISALLFIMCAEVLAIAIREQQNIKGIVVGTKEIKLTQYADYTCVYLNGSNSLENIVKLFEDFYRYAGLKLNIDKTEAIWLGRNNRYGKICGIKITQEPVKVLGIWLSKNPKEISSLNLDQRIEKLRILLNLWSQRGLTIKGKITIIKSKALPLITFATNFIYVPKDVIETIKTILYDFVWKKKQHVKKTTLVETPAKGGLKMPNAAAIIKSNKLNLIKRLLSTDSNCNTTAAFFRRTNNIEKFLSYKNSTKYLHPLPKYYEQLLNMWYSINNREPATTYEILSESIWLNERILVGNRPVYNKSWIDAGILCIKDLLNRNCFMTQAQIEKKGKKERIPKTLWILINF